ncbi:hypothetical protein [Alteribacillus sp. HJP-4]
MKEKVGNCADCHVAVYCMDGFLNGVITDSKRVLCFSCAESARAEKS